MEFVPASSSDAPEEAVVHLTLSRPQSGEGDDANDGGVAAPRGGVASRAARGAGSLGLRPVEEIALSADKFNLLLYELKVRFVLPDKPPCINAPHCAF